MNALPPVLECRKVTAVACGPHRDGEAPVFADLDLTLRAGETLLVLGRSGSGKTTLLRLLNRFDDPRSGTVLFHGLPLDRYDPLELRRRVALVLQTPVLFEGTVADNLTVRSARAPEPEGEAVRSLLEDVGLDASLLARPASDLSLGEGQRVALARALASKPEVLLLDEPTSALDPSSMAVVVDLLLSLQSQRRLSLVVVTHQPELMKRLPASILLLRAGRAVNDPLPEEVARFLEGA